VVRSPQSSACQSQCRMHYGVDQWLCSSMFRIGGMLVR